MGRRWLLLALVAGALIAVALGANAGGIQVGPIPPQDQVEAVPLATPPSAVAPTPQLTLEPEPEAVPVLDRASFWVRMLAMALGALVVLYLAARLARWLLENSGQGAYGRVTPLPPGGGGRETEQVRAAVLAALADLDEAGDPRRAVIACWLRLERVAATAGTPRLASDSPTDFVSRLLEAHGVDGAGLAETYELARYSPHDITEEHRASARRALTDIDARLRVTS
ncbi:DUF4129 domain-containing protein [Nonomuraea sp. NPDC050556]|uniref:DUF4129 domain-containing protein n=1 Tax=Nonomuraea sp. NPDC050556 TaxID=3364369 RepID=UPI0037B924DC